MSEPKIEVSEDAYNYRINQLTEQRNNLVKACKPIVDHVNAWTTRANGEPDEFPVLQAFNRKPNGTYQELIVNLGHLRSLKEVVEQCQ